MVTNSKAEIMLIKLLIYLTILSLRYFVVFNSIISDYKIKLLIWITFLFLSSRRVVFPYRRPRDPGAENPLTPTERTQRRKLALSEEQLLSSQQTDTAHTGKITPLFPVCAILL